jgi:hypothetical protein
MAEYVPVLYVEDSDDLIVSFALGEQAATSLTLLRTPKYEPFLFKEERGVSVGIGDSDTEDRELLVFVKWSGCLVQIESTIRRYTLDIQAVDPAEIKEAKRVLQKMNFDNCFEVEDV